MVHPRIKCKIPFCFLQRNQKAHLYCFQVYLCAIKRRNISTSQLVKVLKEKTKWTYDLPPRIHWFPSDHIKRCWAWSPPISWRNPASYVVGLLIFSFHFILNSLNTVAPSAKSGCFSGGRGKTYLQYYHK